MSTILAHAIRRTILNGTNDDNNGGYDRKTIVISSSDYVLNSLHRHGGRHLCCHPDVADPAPVLESASDLAPGLRTSVSYPVTLPLVRKSKNLRTEMRIDSMRIVMHVAIYHLLWDLISRHGYDRGTQSPENTNAGPGHAGSECRS